MASILNLSLGTNVPLGSPKPVCHSHNEHLPCHSSHSPELSYLSFGLTRCPIRFIEVTQRELYDHNNDCSEHVGDSFTALLLLLVFISAEPNMN